jgi:two-component system cell cycle sensor histidine kinase/response regulator CckA
VSNLGAGTVLAYLAGAAVFTCVVMVLFWSMQRVPPGFSLWAASSAIAAAAAALLADQGHFPALVQALVVPGAAMLAAVLRMEGVRQFLGRKRLDRRLLVLPLAFVGLLAVFAYAWDLPPVRSAILSVTVAEIFWTTAVALFLGGKERHRLFLRFLAGLHVAYGGLWFATGLHWMVSGKGLPLGVLDTPSGIFFICVTAFEFVWLVACLIMSAKWSADALEAARSAADVERRQLASIVDSLPDPTLVLDRDRRVIAWNRLIEESSEVRARDVLGQPWDVGGFATSMGREDPLAILLLDAGKPVPARYLNVKREKDSLSADEEVRSETTGKSSYLWHTASLLRDADGEVSGVIESVRDMTWRVETAAALRESEERYRSLFEQSLDGILVIAADGTILDANPAAGRMLGMTKEEICSTDPSGLIRQEPGMDERLEDRSALGTAVQELVFVRKDGSTFPTECMSVVWRDALKHVRAFVQFRDISERAEAQRLLRDNEARLLEAQALSHVGNWEMDLAAKSIWLSPETLRIFGIAQHSPYFPLETAELTSMCEDPAVLASALQEVMSHGGSYDVEYRITRADDGAARTVHSFGAAVCDDSGRPVKILGATQDVTDARRADLLSDLAQHSVDRAGDQVFWVGPEGKLAYVSDSTCSGLGYTREELLGMTVFEIDPTLDPDSAETWERVKRGGLHRQETVHRAKDGREMPVEVSVSYMPHSGEDYYFVFARDLSERKRLEETFRRALLSVEQAGDQVFWATSEGEIVFVTDSTCGQLGYSREELLGMNISEVDPAAGGEWRQRWASAREKGKLVCESAHRAKDGREMPVEVSYKPFEYDGREYSLVVARNTTERRREMESLPKGDMEMLQYQKLEAVGQLAGGIAHDFNNLLTAIIGYGNLILASDEAQGLKTLRKDAEEIRSAAERAAALTSQILAFASRQALRPRVVPLGEFVACMDKGLRQLLGDGIELSVLDEAESGFVEIDPEQFERVIVNLVSNACEAMPSGGRVTLEVNNVELSEEYCGAYPELRPGGYVQLSVSDTGVGMDAETRLRIFEPFFTTKPPGEGAGLGLSMVYGTVKQSGGHVLAYSEIEKGTTLKVFLPRVPRPGEPEERPERAEPPGKGNETILVVEDEPALRRLVARLLGDLGYRVLVAGDGPEAMELIEDMEDPPDLLITDVVLPGGLQGNELAKEIEDMAPDLPVLYMSGHPRDAIVHAGRLDEGVSFLAKPFTPQNLADKVRENLGSHKPRH